MNREEQEARAVFTGLLIGGAVSLVLWALLLVLAFALLAMPQSVVFLVVVLGVFVPLCVWVFRRS